MVERSARWRVQSGLPPARGRRDPAGRTDVPSRERRGVLRAQDLSAAFTILERMFTYAPATGPALLHIPLVMSLAYLAHGWGELRKHLSWQPLEALEAHLVPLRLATAIIAVVVLSKSDAAPFIYFQF